MPFISLVNLSGNSDFTLQSIVKTIAMTRIWDYPRYKTSYTSENYAIFYINKKCNLFAFLICNKNWVY